MIPADENKFNENSPNESDSFDSILKALLYQLQKFPPDNTKIKNQSESFKKFLSSVTARIENEKIDPLIPLITRSKGDTAIQLFSLLEEIVPKLTDPWKTIEVLLSSPNEHSVLNSLDILINLVSNRIIEINPDITAFFAEKQNDERGFLSSKSALKKIADIVTIINDNSRIEASQWLIKNYLENQEMKLRFLAAKLLDLNDSPPSEQTLIKLFGKEAAEILSPYIEYTRATYQDILYLLPEADKSPPILECLNQCEQICSKTIIREVIAKLGWNFLNYGLSVKKYIGISFNESLPIFVSESEAVFFEKSVNANGVSEYYLFIALGVSPVETNKSSDDNKPVALFRSYNLAHAKLLQDILDIAPLTSGKVKGIIKQMDQIVDDYIKLFNTYSDECVILPEVYNRIKNKILTELEKDSEQSHLSHDVTRLVQMFEDPRTIGGVHTLHGLKRYLHQKGLQLGFKLVDQSRSPNQSVSLVMASENKVISTVKKINFADFEADTKSELSIASIPYNIKVVVEAFGRHLLFEQNNFPSVNIFCYGNEVHYFVWFRNHPIFIRIDYSPPLQGGMIDLQYFGVSNYEIADHPNIYLDAIRIFFQHLEFDVQMEGTHIKARYDKERALNLNQLCERAEFLFALVPYMMDLDWVIGSLSFSSDVKKKIAWTLAELFSRWGVLPLNKILTKDRLGILQDVLITPQGETELVWNGEDDYRDRYTIRIQQNFFDNIFNSIEKLELNIPKFSEEYFNKLGQIYIENKLLNPLRESFYHGEIRASKEGFKRVSENLFQRVHEANWFAEILSKGGSDFKLSVIIAKLIMPLEQTLKFQTTGSLESFEIQSTSLPLKGGNIRLFVMRDNKGIIRMAFYVNGNLLYKKRKSENDPWITNVNLSPLELMSLLRYNSYNVSGSEPAVELIEEEIKLILDELNLHRKLVFEKSIPGEKTISGLRASPGKAAGRVLMGITGRVPEDFNDRIFVDASISPDENTFLFHSAGIVATGGGILSHAGLIATQFNKPALIISGNWKKKPDGSKILHYNTTEFKTKLQEVNGYRISLYYDFQEFEYQMSDGDLVLLDANEGNLLILGQERDTIALYESLKSLGRINEDISKTNSVNDLLILRGKKLQFRHNIEKIIQRLSEPVLAKYALREILLGNFLAGSRSSPDERVFLINLILNNGTIGEFAENYLIRITGEIENKFNDVYHKAEKNIPSAKYPFEVVMPRLEVYQTYGLLQSIINSLTPAILNKIKIEIGNTDKINNISFIRLQHLHNDLIQKIKSTVDNSEQKKYLKHRMRQLSRVDLLLGIEPDEQDEIVIMKAEMDSEDVSVCMKFSNKFIIKPEDGTIELAPMIGWKAANLSELEQIGGTNLVPPWFVIADKAFQYVLDSPVKTGISNQSENITGYNSLRETIDEIISRTDINNNEKSLKIRKLWDMLLLPDELKNELVNAYHQLDNGMTEEKSTASHEEKFFVAVRSSSCEEDAEVAARAGEFDTFLFINGEERLIDFLKKTWSGLWTERAIHNRSVLGNQKLILRGGVIVQRIVWSRVSGVLQTINVAKSELKEIVINAGLGLGEGIVSGIAAADQIIVSKEGNLEKGPLHFNYITSDKKDQVLFNKKAGFGTVLTPTLYHQRFRAALEYVELCELVAVASKLEAAYGYPLDIEYGIEGTKLWILQVRPIATFLPAFKETLNNYPLIVSNNQEIRK